MPALPIKLAATVLQARVLVVCDELAASQAAAAELRARLGEEQCSRTELQVGANTAKSSCRMRLGWLGIKSHMLGLALEQTESLAPRLVRWCRAGWALRSGCRGRRSGRGWRCGSTLRSWRWAYVSFLRFVHQIGGWA